MSYQGKIKRLYLIVEKIQNNKFAPTKGEIHSFLVEQGFDVSERTVDRDIEALRYEFGIRITNNKHRGTYYIENSESLSVNSFLQVLNAAIKSDILLESIKDYNSITEAIQIDTTASYKGLELLNHLLYAIKSTRELEIHYLPFYKNEAKIHVIQPYLLKEYLNRWYIVGFDTAINEIRTFGIDRIEKLHVTTTTFKVDSKIKPKELFENTIGINYLESEPERVVLRFSAFQANYVKTQKLHESQVTIAENEEYCDIELFIVPNHEFMQRILMYAQDVKVIEPNWLMLEIKDRLSKSLNNYS